MHGFLFMPGDPAGVMWYHDQAWQGNWPGRSGRAECCSEGKGGRRGAFLKAGAAYSMPKTSGVSWMRGKTCGTRWGYRDSQESNHPFKDLGSVLRTTQGRQSVESHNMVIFLWVLMIKDIWSHSGIVLHILGVESCQGKRVNVFFFFLDESG